MSSPESATVIISNHAGLDKRVGETVVIRGELPTRLVHPADRQPLDRDRVEFAVPVALRLDYP